MVLINSPRVCITRAMNKRVKNDGYLIENIQSRKIQMKICILNFPAPFSADFAQLQDR